MQSMRTLSAVELQKDGSAVWFKPEWIQLADGLIGSPPSRSQELVHIKTPFMSHKVIRGSSQFMSKNAESLAFAVLLGEA
jgi:hypothetical protein